MTASGGSHRTIEAIAAAATGPLCLGLYLFPERERTLALVRRAEAAGCRAIALTVDSPRFGRKERSLRTEDDFDWPEAGNLAGLPPPTLPWVRGAPATWADVDWLRTITVLPILLKGILTAEDAAIAPPEASKGSSSPTMAAGSSTARPHRSRFCPRSLKRSARRSKSCSTAASAPART
jgi:hypothetical protein